MRLQSLSLKLALLFISLFAFLQIAQLTLVRQSVVASQRATAQQQLQTADRVFSHLLSQQAQTKQQALQFLLADIHIKEIFISQDRAAIRQALITLQRASQASVLEYHANDGQLHVSTLGNAPQLVRFKSANVGIVSRQETPYQWLNSKVTAAPTPIGEVSAGFAFNVSLAHTAKALSQSDFSFFKKTGQGPWQLLASSLPTTQQPALIQWMQQVDAPANAPLVANNDGAVHLKRMAGVGNTALMVVMHAPTAPAQAGLIAMFVNVVRLASIGLALCCLAVWAWQRHTIPVLHRLTEHLEALANHGRASAMSAPRQDELGQLAQAFNRMRSSVQQRLSQLEQLCLEDPLTGLANQLGFTQALQQAIDARRPSDDKPGLLTLVLVNLQQFKALNMLMGRGLADAVLRETGRLLKQQLRNPQDVVGRLDADMFAVLLVDISQPDVAHYVEKVHGLFKQALTIQAPADDQAATAISQPLLIQIRTGIALFPAHGHDAEHLLRHALLAVQSAKKQHTQRAIYHETMAIEMAEQHALVDEIKTAIAQSQVMLYLQPMVELASQKVVAAEALLRWAHPEKGMLFPEQFLPMIERTEVIHSLTDWILAQAYHWLAEFKAQGIPIRLSVNITARDLTNHGLPQQIKSLSERYDCPINALTLEVTEEALMQDADRAETMVRQLAMAGISLSIDQFGSGYSSLTALRRFTMHELKIDKTFITYLHKNPADQAMTKSIIELAHNLGMFVVAEGIESEEVMTQLQQLGCEAGQGFFIAKPMPAGDFPLWLERWRGEHQLELDIGDDSSLSVNLLADMPADPDLALDL